MECSQTGTPPTAGKGEGKGAGVVLQCPVGTGGGEGRSVGRRRKNQAHERSGERGGECVAKVGEENEYPTGMPSAQ